MADQQPIDYKQYRPGGPRIPHEAPQKPLWQMTAPEKFSLAIARGYVPRDHVEEKVGTKDVTTVYNSGDFRGLDAALMMGSRRWSNGQGPGRTMFSGTDGARGEAHGF